MNVLLTGTTPGGAVAMLLADASWTTVASAADSLQAASRWPITWAVYQVKARHVNEALIEVGLGDGMISPGEPMAWADR